MTDSSERGVSLGPIISIVLGIVAVAIGLADILGYIESSPPAYLIAVGLLLVLSEYRNLGQAYGGQESPN